MMAPTVAEERRPTFTTADRDALLERAVERMSGDERIEAIVLTGSLGRGGGDRWSDVDLDAVVAGDADTEDVTRSWERIVYDEWPVAHHYATAFGPTLVRGFLLRSGLLLDLAFTPVGEFSTWAPVRVLVDRTGRTTAVSASPDAWSPTPDAAGEAGFAAHDVLHACVALNRNRPWQALYFLGRIRNRTLALASERHGFDAEDFARVDDLPDPETVALDSTLVAGMEPDALFVAIEAAQRAFLDELGRHDPALAGRLADPFAHLVAETRRTLDERGR